jgi:hypothetical protein
MILRVLLRVVLQAVEVHHCAPPFTTGPGLARCSPLYRLPPARAIKQPFAQTPRCLAAVIGRMA